MVLIKPVTDLNYLSEFKQYPVPESLLGIWQYVPAKSHLPVLVRIGKSDHRVGTDLAVAFAREIHADLQLARNSQRGADKPVTAGSPLWWKFAQRIDLQLVVGSHVIAVTLD